jgi:ribosomal protein L7/L12
MAEPEKQLPPAVLIALNSGNKIEAIKLLRKEWNLELKEAKDLVDGHIRTQPALDGIYRAQAVGSRRILWAILLAVLAVAVYYYGRSHP